jgi:aspartate kinase
MLVMKFGGTSVGSAERILGVAAIVLAEAERDPVVVTSAMTGMTDVLLALADAALSGNALAVAERLATVEARHLEAARGIDPSGRWDDLIALLAHLREHANAILAMPPATALARDTIASFGELLATHMVARAITMQGGAGYAHAAPVIATDDHYGEATPENDATRLLAAAAYARAASGTLVAPGFIGQVAGRNDPAAIGAVATLGRGGSDYAATLLAAALDAEACWIYTDVDGVFSADPRIVPEAVILPVVSFATAGRLALCGAKVLHPRSVAPAARAGFELRVRNTFHPEHPGTLLVAASDETDGIPQAVAGRKHLSAVTLHGPGLAEIQNLFGRMCQAATEAGAEILLAAPPVPGHDPQIIIETAYSHAVLACVQSAFARETTAGHISAIQTRDNLAICALVGDDLVGQVVAQAQRALAAEGVRPLNLSAAPEGVTFVLPAAQLERATRRLHRDIIEPALSAAARKLARPYADGQWAAGGRPEQRRRRTPQQH